MLTEQAHRRRNSLTGEWVLVSPHRTQRPWQGQQEPQDQIIEQPYDPNCYLCPNNQRIHGEHNPDYHDTFVFDNDHPALLPNDAPQHQNDPLLTLQAIDGTCRVICFSPQHHLTLAAMTAVAIEKVISTWQQQFTELSQRYTWIQIFENKGLIMGCSNPHPHGQIWASNFLPNEAEKEQQQQQHYYQQHQRPLLLDYAQREIAEQTRVVAENEHWLVVVPFWAFWPFETLLLPKQASSSIDLINNEQKQTLAVIMKQLLSAYDQLFNCSFPYSMGWHNAPSNKGDVSYWQLHAHYYPPLLRSASIKKFRVGYEMLAESQRDSSPEQAAQQLRQAISKIPS